MNADKVLPIVREAFREAFNESIEAAAREAPESTLNDAIRAFLVAWREVGRRHEEWWVEHFPERLS